MLIAVRSDVEHYSHKPRIFTSNQRVADFFEHTTSRTVNEFAVKLQAYCVAGVETPRTLLPHSPTPCVESSRSAPIPQRVSPQQQLLDMKRRVKDLINEKLRK